MKVRNATKFVFIVEDDEFVSDVYKRKLIKEGFSVAIARDGEEALREVHKRKPDLILLDIVIPLKDGFQVLKEIRADEGLKDIPVIIMSNLSQRKDIERANEFGIADYIIKSNVSISEMVERVVRCLFPQG